MSWKLGELGRLVEGMRGPGREGGETTMQPWCMVLSYSRKQRAVEKESSCPVRKIKSRVPVARGFCAT